jgi:hypothetical protein
MNRYAINDLTKIAFNPTIYTEAHSPKEAVEKALNCKVKRVTNGGSIVVYGSGASYVYEVDQISKEMLEDKPCT